MEAGDGMTAIQSSEAVPATAVARPNGARPDAAGRDHLEMLLQVQNQVLEHIVAGAELAVTLGRIADVLAQLAAPARGLLLWCEGDPSGRPRIAPAELPPELAATWAARLAEGVGLEPALEAFLRALAAAGYATVRRLVHSQSDEPVAALVLVDRRPLALGRAEQYALDTLALLARSAIEGERHRAALQSATDRFAALARTIPGVIYQRVVKPDGTIRYTYISDAAKDLFGVEPAAIIADPQALFDCHGPEYYATFRERLLAASRSLAIWDVEATIITRDGQRKYTHALARPHRLPDGSVVWDGVILDATRIKEAELAAVAAESRTRTAIIESIPHGFALFDPGGRLVTWNGRLVDLYPALEGTLQAQLSYADLVRAEIASGIDPVPAETDPEVRFHQRMAQHRQADAVMERQLADGRWILVNEHRTADGGLVVLHTDISELKVREAALRRSNQELESFASIASHDLQEPLRKIEAFGDRLRQRYHSALGDDGQMYVERMQSAVKRMRALINDLLDYSRVTTKARPFTAVNLSDVLSGVLVDLQMRLESTGGTVETGPLPTIDADATQMRQLFQNLIANALKFHRPDVPPRITITAREVAGGREQQPGERRVELRVADNGIGFEMKYAERIFGIFQRLHTRAEYEGTGIGLATCRKIVERHGGTITALSAPGEGATFIIELPAHQPVMETKP
jgi:signal transduction histidine kinase